MTDPEGFRQLLLDRNLSQAAFARAIKVSPPTVTRWISGQNNPKIKHLKSMAKALNLSAETVMNYFF